MIDKPLPDKYIRKALYTLITSLNVPVFDYRVAGSELPNKYVLLSTQVNEVDRTTKCGYKWVSSILLDIVTRYQSAGNTGSRLETDELTEDIRFLLQDKLELEGGLDVLIQRLDFPSDIVSSYNNSNVFRKFIRVNLLIN